MTGQRPLESDPCPEWWPYRNQFLLTIAAMHAYKCGASELIIGAVVTDGEAHTDGRPEFFKRMSHLLGYQEGGIAISTPAITLTTVALVKQAGIPISVLAGTHSCHVSNLACGRCRGCLKREAVIYELGYIEV